MRQVCAGRRTVAQSDYSAKIAGVLNTVECHQQVVFGFGRQRRIFRNLIYGHNRLGRCQRRHALDVGGLNTNSIYSAGHCGGVFGQPGIGGQQMAAAEMGQGVEHAFGAFGHKQTQFAAVLGLGEPGHVLAQCGGELHQNL